MHKIEITYNKHPNNILSELAKKYGSDKGSPIDDDISLSGWHTHVYTDFYDLIFSQKRGSVKHLLECGIGTNNPSIKSSMGVNGVPGSSLRMWRDYFSNAEIIGVDIDPNILFEEERIKTYQVDQTSALSTQEFLSNIDYKFDIIIEDGLHEPYAQIEFFKNTFDYLAEDGVYIIEDAAFTFKYVEEYLSNIGANFMTIKLPSKNITSPSCLIVVRK